MRLISGVFTETKGVRKGPDSGRMKFKSWGVAYIRGFTVHIYILLHSSYPFLFFPLIFKIVTHVARSLIRRYVSLILEIKLDDIVKMICLFLLCL